MTSTECTNNLKKSFISILQRSLYVSAYNWTKSINPTINDCIASVTMPTTNGSSIKIAEVFWKLDASLIEYRCLLCEELFEAHSDCFWHIRNCLQIDVDSTADNKDFLLRPKSVYDADTASEYKPIVEGIYFKFVKYILS